MKRTALFLSLFAVVGSASATFCPAGTVHAGSAEPIFPNRCNEGYTPPASGGSSSDSKAAAAAIAGAQAGSVATGGNSTSAALGGSARASGGAGGNATGGNASQRQQQQQGQSLSNRNDNSSGVIIQGAQSGSGDRSSYNYVAPPPIIHGPAAPALAAGNLVVVPGVCGPRVRIISTQVVGQHYGAMGGRYDEQNGYTETLGEYLDENGNPAEPFVQRGPYLIGHQVTQYAAILGTSSAASFSVGGFVDSKGLQGGAAGSGARQQLVKGLQVSECLYQEPVRTVTVYEERIVKQPPKVIYQNRVIYRDRAAKQSCCCTAVVAPSCAIGGVK